MLRDRIRRYVKRLFCVDETEKTKKMLRETIKLQGDSLREPGESYSETLRLHHGLAVLRLKIVNFLGL